MNGTVPGRILVQVLKYTSTEASALKDQSDGCNATAGESVLPMWTAASVAETKGTFRAGVLKVVDIDPQGSMEPSNGSMNSLGVE